jgi:hypothetical protein
MTRLPDPSPGSFDEQSLCDLLAPLRDLQAPLATQIANRQSLANVLHERRQQSASRPRPWWRRNVSVPIPLAAAILLLAVVFTLQQLVSSQHASSHLAREAARDAAPGPAHQPQAPPPRGGDSREAMLAALQPSATVQSMESGIYLSGIGSLNSKVVYLDKGFLP